MKYEGLRIIEAAVYKNNTVVNNLSVEQDKSAAAVPVDSPVLEITAAENIKQNSEPKSLPAPAVSTDVTMEYHAARPVARIDKSAEAAREEKPQKKAGRRKLLPALLRQFIIAVVVIGALLGLKYVDSGFAADVFQGVKDIISYNYEAAGNYYPDEDATIVNAVLKFFS